jgi:hypothetical protein
MKYVKAILITLTVGGLLDVLISIILPDRVVNAAFVIIVSFLLVGILLVGFGTAAKNRWGMNLEPVKCPVCGSPMPQTRQPKSLRQALWGGGTCGKCGCEMDKWGRLITPFNLVSKTSPPNDSPL